MSNVNSTVQKIVDPKWPYFSMPHIIIWIMRYKSFVRNRPFIACVCVYVCGFKVADNKTKVLVKLTVLDLTFA